MQLNRQTDYALRVLIFLALKKEGQLSQINEISKNFNIVRNHLIKIVAKLAKLRYITTIRGSGGGLKINPNVLEINIYEIVVNFEPTFTPINCQGLNCPLAGICHLDQVLCKASSAFTKELSMHTLKDMLPRTCKGKSTILQRLSINPCS